MRLQNSRFARDDKEPKPQLGEKAGGRYREGTAPLSGAEEQTAPAFSAYAQHA
jgi:hypothetical protein